MTRSGTWLAIAFCAAVSAGAQAPPVDKGETLGGKKVNFPVVMRGEIATCVFGFGNDSANKVTVWLESLSSDQINAWSVVNLENMPSMSRGALRMTMKHGTPKELLDRSIVVGKYSKEWKRYLEVTKDNLPTVVLFDKDGNVVWKRQGTFSSSISDELKLKIGELKGK